MKLFVLLFVSLFSVAAFSCPELTGTYQCTKDDQDPTDTGVIAIQNVVQDGNTFYKWEDMDKADDSGMMPADGKQYADGDNTYVGTCEGNVFKVQITGVDAEYGPFKVFGNFFLDANTNLTQEGSIEIAEGKYPFQETCTRLK